MAIFFHTEDAIYNIKQRRRYKSWLKNVLVSERKTLGEINIIFCSDEYLLKVNQMYLNHDYFTDIITFNYNDETCINGDLFLSIDRIKENAAELSLGFIQELNRVMVHGVLHLLGYDDHSPEDILRIREKESYYLTKF